MSRTIRRRVAKPSSHRTAQSEPQRVARGLAGLWDAGKLHPLVGPTFPLQRAADALREIESRLAVGKVVLTVRS